MQIHCIYTEIEGKRLDLFLSELISQTRSLIQRSLEKNLICVNDKIITKNGYILQNGDQIKGQIELRPSLSQDIEPQNIPLDIIYEDEFLIVINKQADLTVHPTQDIRNNTLVNALLYRYQINNLSSLNSAEMPRPGIVHRLDKNTSGLILIAKTNEAHLGLAQQLSTRTLKRIYWAICVGKLKDWSGKIEAPIGRHTKDRKRMAVILDNQKKSRLALTHWEIIENFDKHSLVKVSLATGRTHQIRVHFEYINYPILGDPVYGGKRSLTHLIKRQCLHAKEIQFIHPISQQIMHFETDLPIDFASTLKAIS